MFLSKVKFAVIVVLAIGAVGSGLGSLAHNSKADPPSSPIAAKDDNSRTDAPAPGNAALVAPAPAKPKAPAAVQNQNIPGLRRVEIRHQLSQTVDYPGLEDARATFNDLIDQLSKRYNLTFSVSENAFHAIDPKVEVPRFEIATTPIPEMRGTMLKTVLQKLLERLPPKLGAMYILRSDRIEITTEKAVRAEFGVPAHRPLMPLVGGRIGNLPIADALRRLAEQSEYNVVTDPRVADKLKTPATTDLNNVPIDTAVRLLANIAGVSMVRLDNVFYVTTAENAKHLREEQTKLNAETSKKEAETPKKPAPDKGAK